MRSKFKNVSINLGCLETDVQLLTRLAYKSLRLGIVTFECLMDAVIFESALYCSAFV